MNAIVAVLIAQVMKYLVDHASDIGAFILECIPDAKNVPGFNEILENLKREPTSENLEAAASSLEDAGLATREQFASVLLNNYNVKV